MKPFDISSNNSEWDILANTGRTQAAMMTISAGGKEGGPTNAHPDSDQWLLVLDGHGEATVNGHSVALHPGVLVLIEAGDKHEIQASATSALKTVNFYGPPAEIED